MRVLLDTNVVIDWILEREPWFSEALAFWQLVAIKDVIGFITATTVTDIFYVTRRLAGLDRARDAVRRCLDAFEVCPVDGAALEDADALPGSDFEDNLQIACARLADLDAIITRDPAGFRGHSRVVLTPAEAVARLGH